MHILSDRFEADIFLPNGLYIIIPWKREDTLRSVKKQLLKAMNLKTTRYSDIGDQSSFLALLLAMLS